MNNDINKLFSNCMHHYTQCCKLAASILLGWIPLDLKEGEQLQKKYKVIGKSDVMHSAGRVGVKAEDSAEVLWITTQSGNRTRYKKQRLSMTKKCP